MKNVINPFTLLFYTFIILDSKLSSNIGRLLNSQNIIKLLRKGCGTSTRKAYIWVFVSTRKVLGISLGA